MLPAIKSGQIVILNGAQRAGKSSNLPAAVQAEAVAKTGDSQLTASIARALVSPDATRRSGQKVAPNCGGLPGGN
jgi:hypothetical protein